MKFTIRDLLWLTVVVGMGLGWWLHYRAVDHHRQALRAHAEYVRSVLEDAKLQCSQLELDVKFYRSVKPGQPVLSYMRPGYDVDWEVLDTPIPIVGQEQVLKEPAETTNVPAD